jgi:hypothetical protein
MLNEIHLVRGRRRTVALLASLHHDDGKSPRYLFRAELRRSVCGTLYAVPIDGAWPLEYAAAVSEVAKRHYKAITGEQIW